MAEGDIKRYSMDELVAMRRNDQTSTNAEAPAFDIEEEFWDKAEIVMPAGKVSIHLRIDHDVLDWFKAQGKGHLTRMNAVLRSYVEGRKHDPRR